MTSRDLPPSDEVTLDPEDWEVFRTQAHSAMDAIIDYVRDVRDRPVWRPVPVEVEERLRSPAPEHGRDLDGVLDEFCRDVLPYPVGNIHPRFWSWVSGTGSPVGMLADLLAAGMNSYNLGIDDSAAVRVELQVLDWFKTLFHFPAESSGLIVSGGSMANLVGLAVGRTAKGGPGVRSAGVGSSGDRRLTIYASRETHSSVQKAVELLGLGSTYLRFLPVDDDYRIEVRALRDQIRDDVARGLMPAILIGTAGTVNTGAIDPLHELADIAEEHSLWFHVDGAFGAFTALLDEPPANLTGVERADSLAFDLHKWLHQPYNCGAVLVRNASLHRDTFFIEPPYLDVLNGGVAGGPINFSALGVQLSRSFSALRVWLTIKTYGLARFRQLVAQNIAQAQYLDARIRNSSELEILAPTAMNIVNYRYNPGGVAEEMLSELNARILVQLQQRGIAAPSSTRLHGAFSIRVSITNHRTRREDLDALVDATTAIGREIDAR